MQHKKNIKAAYKTNIFLLFISVIINRFVVSIVNISIIMIGSPPVVV